MELLRFFTAGNVDDGKSTLIGRLLYDSHSVSTDIIETLTKQSKSTGADAEIDLALLTDGLRAEREQGITIDVAYKYFTTEKRKFIIADTPGHAQYTRNMFTGASNTDLAIILIDARNGITDQTKRHSIISGILQIPHILVCVNKMDLVDFDEAVFRKIEAEYQVFAKQIGLKKVSFIPVSAYTGDHVVKNSENMSWFTGPTLFDFLENVEIDREESTDEGRFQVQYVIRPQTEALHDYRGYAGSILSGTFKKGDRVRIFPIDALTTIEKIEQAGIELETAASGQPVILHLSDDLDVSRGSTIVPENELPETENLLNATICWMDSKALQNGQKFLLQQGSFRTKAAIREIEGKIDIHTFETAESAEPVQLNDFAKISVKTAETVSFDPYVKNRKTGAFILINENTNNTVAAGVLEY